MTEIKSAALELGTERIRKLLVQYAVPAIIAMTASSLYNMVDSIFIGHGVGPLAISGLALTFPLMNLAAAFGSLVGVGAATLISMRLGQRDYETAQRVLGNVLVLNLIIGIAFGLAALLFLDPILYFFGASEATIGYAREYMTVILLGNVVTHMYLGLNSVLRASGHPRKSMYATINTVVINTILDPLFIFGFGWGIRGAAIATVLAQVISLVWQLRILSNKQELLHFRRGIYRLRKKIVRDMLAIGMSPFLMNLAACFIVILINKGLKEYGGDLMIGAYGIVNRLAFFFVMIVLQYGCVFLSGFLKSAKGVYSFTLQYWDQLWRIGSSTMLRSVEYALIVSIAGTVFAMLFAYYMDRRRIIGRSLFDCLATLPYMLPGTCFGIGYILAFNHAPLKLTGTALIVLANMLFKQLPTSTKICTASLALLPEVQERSARDLGAGRLAVLRDVVFPALRPAFLSCFVYNFTSSMTTAGSIIFLIDAKRQLAVFKLFDAVYQGDYALASLIASIITVIVLLVEGLAFLITRKGENRRVSRT